MLGHVLDAANAVGDSKKIIVTGHGAEAVRAIYSDPSISMVEQAEQLGTGHAVHMALPELRENSKVVILYGDVPLITPNTISQMLNAVDDKSIGLINNPTKQSSGLRTHYSRCGWADRSNC